MAASPASPRRDRIALYLLQFGAVAVVLAAVPFKAFELDRYFVPKELVLHACAAAAALMCVSERKRLGITLVDLLLAGFLAASAASAVFAANRWAAERAVAISLSGVLVYWTASALRREELGRPLLVALAFGVVLGAATSLAQAYGAQTELFSINRAPGGTFGNRNFVAHLCAIGLPIVVLVALTARRIVGSILGAVGVAVVAAALVLSRSRGAWLAVLVLAGVMIVLGAMTRERWSEGRTVRRLVVLAIGTAAGVAGAIVVPNRLAWKSDSPYMDSAAGLVNYKEGSGHGRLVQYTNSLRMTISRPVLGAGPGNWPVVYPKFASHNDPSLSQDDGTASNPWPSSDWVAYLSERGVVGFGLLLLALVGIAGRAVRELRAGGRDPERVLTAVALLGTLAATAVVGAFDAVLLVAVPTFFVWALAGALAPPKSDGVSWGIGVRQLGAAVVLVLGAVMVVRSAAQLASMAVFNGSTRIASLERAALLDPGSYRIQLRVAQSQIARGDCTHGRPHARAARDLFPNAAEPKRLLASCGGK